MLRLKRGVDIKELEKYGFKPKYDTDTGEICAYEKYNNRDGIILKPKRTFLIKKFSFSEYFEICPYGELFDVDLLYDLIQAGLVEK